MSGEYSQVVETKGYIVVYVLIQALIGRARVTMETHTHTHTHTHKTVRHPHTPLCVFD